MQVAGHHCDKTPGNYTISPAVSAEAERRSGRRLLVVGAAARCPKAQAQTGISSARSDSFLSWRGAVITRLQESAPSGAEGDPALISHNSEQGLRRAGGAASIRDGLREEEVQTGSLSLPHGTTKGGSLSVCAVVPRDAAQHS